MGVRGRGDTKAAPRTTPPCSPSRGRASRCEGCHGDFADDSTRSSTGPCDAPIVRPMSLRSKLLTRGRLLAWGFVAFTASVVACASTPPNAAMRAKVAAGCRDTADCSALVAEANARVHECESAARPRDCSPEHADAAEARALLLPFQRADDAHRQRELALRKSAAEEQRRLLAASRAEEEQRRVEGEREARTRRDAELERAEAATTIRERTYRALGPNGRRDYLAACYAAGQEVIAPAILEIESSSAQPKSCALLLYLLMAAGESDAEGEALIAQAEKHLAETAPREATVPRRSSSSVSSSAHSSTRASSRSSTDDESDSSSRSLLCCDGTLSPTCTCDGSHRGCCSHHKGVCGCAD